MASKIYRITRDAAGNPTGVTNVAAPTVGDYAKAACNIPAITDTFSDSSVFNVVSAVAPIVVGGVVQNYVATGRYVDGLFRPGSMIPYRLN